MNRAAVFALAETLIAVELFEQRRKVAHDTFELHFCAMHQMVAILAVPLKSIHCSFRSRHFDDDADGARLQALRRVAHMLRQQKNLSFFNRNFNRGFALASESGEERCHP